MEAKNLIRNGALLVTAALFLAAAAPSAGQAKAPAPPPPDAAEVPPGPLKCVVCEKTGLTGTIYRHKFGLVCDQCRPLERTCANCGIPMREPGGKSADGRAFCKFEFATLVFKQEEARKVYDETVLDLRRLLGGVLDLKFTNLNVQVFDVDYWNHRSGRPVAETMRRPGFAQTITAGREMKHTILLLSGVPRDDLASVCAHEHTHLWLNENMPELRAMEQNTIEGLCELVAFKLAAARQLETQQTRIRRNTYTAGRIETLIAAEQRHGMFALLEWARRGTNAIADDASLAAFSAKNPPRPAPSLVSPVPAKAPPVLNPAAKPPPVASLRLIGLFLTPKKRAAQVNDQLFEPGDVRRIQLGEKIAMVKCIEIRTNAVVLSVDGSTNHVTLWHVGR